MSDALGNWHRYADDIVSYYTGSHINAIRENLQEDLKRVEQWLASNRLILNHSKTKGLLFRTRQLSHQTLYCRSKERTWREWRNLILSGLCSAMNNRCNKVNKRPGLLVRIRSCLALKAADSVWGELSATSSRTLQRLENRAARIVLGRAGFF